MKSNEYNITLSLIFLIFIEEYITFEVKKKSYVARQFTNQHPDIIMLLFDVFKRKSYHYE